jgi:hypothetical protein
MQIGTIVNLSDYSPVPKQVRSGLKEAKRAGGSRDSLEISPVATEADIMARKLVLTSIKSKIAAGFYSSPEVVEDLSEKLSKVFKDIV